MNKSSFRLLPSLLWAAFGAASAGAATLAFEPFQSTTSAAAADPANGYYFSNVNGANGSVQSEANRSVAGGPVIGFGDHPWTSLNSSTYFRVQLGNLDTPSREAVALEFNDGGVRVMNFRTSGGAASSAVRSVARRLNAFPAQETYYLSAVTSVYRHPSSPQLHLSGGYLFLGAGNAQVENAEALFEGVQWGYRARPAGGFDFVLRARNASGSAIAEEVLMEDISPDENHFFALRVEIDPAGPDTLTWWLNPGAPASAPAPGGVVTHLNAFTSGANLTHFAAATFGLDHGGGNNSVNRVGYFDSLALGTSYLSVAGEPLVGGTPPQPSPPLWAEGSPTAASATRVTLEAQPVTASGFPVEYFFENADNPASNSGWVSDPFWTERYLLPESTHRYRFKARDLSPGQVETDWSVVRTVTTPAETDTQPPEPNPPVWEAPPALSGPNTVTMRATPAIDPEGNGPVEYYFANLTDPARDSGWQLSPEFTDAQLPFAQTFVYTYKVRDASANANETEWAPEVAVTTPALPDGETYWLTFDENPRDLGWYQWGADNTYDYYAEGYLLVRQFRTIEDQRFAVDLSRSYNHEQPFWLEFDWRFEAVYEWPRGFLGVMDSSSPNGINFAGAYYQRRNLSLNTESQRAIAYNAAGTGVWFATSDFPRASGGYDARTRIHYAVNAVGEGWMTLEIVDLASGEVIVSASGKVLDPGQTFTFDSLGFMNLPAESNSPQWFDRVRIDNLYFSTEMPGDAYLAGQGIARPAPSWIGDVTPPSPNPPLWAGAPVALTATQVSLTGQPVVDDQYGVQYYFENVANPVSNSGWVSEPVWIERHLDPETTYQYRFKARDLSPNRNETEWSAHAGVTTPAETDTQPPEPNPPVWADEPAALGGNRVFMRAGPASDPEGNGPVEYYFANLTDPTRDSGWQTSPDFVDAGLPFETEFLYRFKVRDISANRNETDWSPTVAVVTGSTPLLGDYVRAEGFWAAPRIDEQAYYQVLYREEATPARAPVIVYMLNTALPRIGLENDASILSDFIDEGYIVVTIDLQGNPAARHPDLDWDMWSFRRAITGHGTPSILDGTAILPDTVNIFVLPAGYRLVRDLVYWDIEAHGAFGTLNRIMNTFNGHIVNTFGVDPVSSPAEMRGPNGEELDYLLRMDIAYPSQAAEPVPLLFESSTNSNRLNAYRPAGVRAPYFLGKLTNGWAWAMVDHCYNPLARDYHYGYWDGGYTLEDWNGLASITAAVRFLRAHAADYNIDPNFIGGMGHSKGSYTITRLANPDHPNQGEHFSFAGQPAGSPEPQPWQGHSSQIRVSYQSMGNGTRRIQYLTANNVPTVVACGLFDQYNQWLVFPDLVRRYEELDLNHLALWMTDLGHTLPDNHDPILDRHRYDLVFDFFRQYLQPAAAPEALYFLPRADYPDLPLNGMNRMVPARELLPAGKEDWAVEYVPISVFFAPGADVATANAGGLEVIRTRTGERIGGEWVSLRGGSLLSFIPATVLPDHEELEIRLHPALRSLEGVPHDGTRSHFIGTGNLSAAYDAWSLSLPPDGRGVLDDPFARGAPNIVAYALGLSVPGESVPSVLELGVEPAGAAPAALYLEFPEWRPELRYRVEVSHDLESWLPATQSAPTFAGERVRGHHPLDPEGGPLFLRLAIEPR